MAKDPKVANNLQPPLSLLIDNIDYIVRLIGVDHVGLGFDFDGISSAPKELKDVTKMPLVTKALLKRGYSKAEVKKYWAGISCMCLKRPKQNNIAWNC